MLYTILIVSTSSITSKIGKRVLTPKTWLNDRQRPCLCTPAGSEPYACKLFIAPIERARRVALVGQVLRRSGVATPRTSRPKARNRSWELNPRLFSETLWQRCSFFARARCSTGAKVSENRRGFNSQERFLAFGRFVLEVALPDRHETWATSVTRGALSIGAIKSLQNWGSDLAKGRK